MDGPVAVVFDFDGTLVDTEWPIYERAHRAAAALGAELSPELWSVHAVGSSHDDPWWDALGPLLGLDVDQATFDRAYEAVDDVPAARDVAELVPGADRVLDRLHGAGIPLAVASGSSRDWLEHHLDRFSLADRFVTLVGIDHPDVVAGKPAPDVYRAALAELVTWGLAGLDPATVVAVEDTARGVAAARAAGIGRVIAVPSRLTVHHDLSAADLVLPALADLTLDLLAGPPPGRSRG